jgi:multimeric flavodoxin WrbA
VTDYSDLKALFINCTLKRAPEVSNTQGLADKAMTVRALDHDIAVGVWPDMTEHGWDKDDWPAIFDKVMAADILVLCTPIWLGEKSSVCTQIVERLYGNSHLLNESGQYRYYGRVAGCLVTGNEDGVKHCCSTSATRSRPRPTPVGSARPGPARATSTRAPVGPRTTSPTGTPRS